MDGEATDNKSPQEKQEEAMDETNTVYNCTELANGKHDEQLPTTPPTPNDVTPRDVPMAELKDNRSPSVLPQMNEDPHYKTKYIMSGHARSISAIKFSPDGTMLASCGGSYSVFRSLPTYV